MDFLPSGPLVLANADHAAPSTSPAASSARTFSLRYPTAHDADYLSSEGGSLTSTASGDLSLKLQRPSTQRGGRAVNRKWIGRVPRPGAEVELAVVWDEKAQVRIPLSSRPAFFLALTQRPTELGPTPD